MGTPSYSVIGTVINVINRMFAHYTEANTAAPCEPSREDNEIKTSVHISKDHVMLMFTGSAVEASKVI